MVRCQLLPTKEYRLTYTVLPSLGRSLTVTVVAEPRLPDWRYSLPPDVEPTSTQAADVPVPVTQVKVTVLPVKVEPGIGSIITLVTELAAYRAVSWTVYVLPSVEPFSVA